MTTAFRSEKPGPAPHRAMRTSPLPVYLDQNPLREGLRKLWRRRVLILTTMAILTALGAVRLSQIPARYVASAMIMFDPRPNSVANVDAMLLAGGSRDSEAVYTEATVLSSRELIGKMVDRLDLGKYPEFNGSAPPTGLLQLLTPLRWIADSWRSTPVAEPLTPAQAASRQASAHDALVDAILAHLQITPKPRTRILTVSFDSLSPELAALVANTLSDLYLVNQLEAKFVATQRVTGWLDSQLNELRKKVDMSDRAVQDYRARADLYGGKDAAPLEQQIADLSTQLTVTRTDRAAAEAKLRYFREAIEAPEGQTAISEVLDSPLIQRLREQESEAQRNVADLTAQFGERHPKMIAARAHLADIQSRIRDEARQHLTSLENIVNVTRTREQVLASQIEELKRKLASWNSSEVQLRALEMEATANRTLMETFLSQFKQTSAQETGGIQTPDARILSRAVVPDGPASPNKTSFMAIILVVSAAVGISLAMLAEYLDRGFRSGVQFELATEVPVLAMIPKVPKDRGLPADYVIDRPVSGYAEAIRSIYASILLSSTDEPLRTIVIASSRPREGKSTLALSLARLIASNGHKVVLVEADLRHPSIHQQLGIERRIGLAEVLVGDSDLSDALYRDPKSAADILLTGLEAVNPSTLVASHQMTELLGRLSQRYDRVIIDTPPALAVSDGWLLSNLADATIFVCLWAVTSRETAALGLKELREANARIIGAVLSTVDTRKSQSYGYADTNYHYAGNSYYKD